VKAGGKKIHGLDFISLKAELFMTTAVSNSTSTELTPVLSAFHLNNEGCFKKSFTNLKAYINLFRGHVECFYLL
jgi:hypothetical protein